MSVTSCYLWHDFLVKFELPGNHDNNYKIFYMIFFSFYRQYFCININVAMVTVDESADRFYRNTGSI